MAKRAGETRQERREAAARALRRALLTSDCEARRAALLTACQQGRVRLAYALPAGYTARTTSASECVGAWLHEASRNVLGAPAIAHGMTAEVRRDGRAWAWSLFDAAGALDGGGLCATRADAESDLATYYARVLVRMGLA